MVRFLLLLVALLVFPVRAQTLGPELVEGGSFESADGWNLGYSWQILPAPGALAFHNEGYSYTISRAVPVSAGTAYSVSYKITGSAGSTNPLHRIRLVGVGSVAQCPFGFGDGLFSCVLTAPAGAHSVAVWPGGGFGGVLDDVSVREVLP